MWIIEHTRWDRDEEYSRIQDVVVEYNDLIHYFQLLLDKNPHLRMVSYCKTIPVLSRERDSVTILEGHSESFSIIRIEPVQEPTLNV